MKAIAFLRDRIEKSLPLYPGDVDAALAQAVSEAVEGWCGDPEAHEPHDDEGTAVGRYMVTTCPGTPDAGAAR